MSNPQPQQAAMEAPMSSSLGAMGPLLRKFDLLLSPEYPLRKSLKQAIQFLKEDLEEVSAALVQQSMEESPSNKAKYWMDEVREISYDIEDSIDNMMRSHTAATTAKVRSVHHFKVGRPKIYRLPKMLKPSTRMVRIAELRALLREASERHERYQLQLDGSLSNRRFAFNGTRNKVPALYEAATDLVDVDDLRKEITEWLTNQEEKQLKVLLIFGPAGVGKTTLIRALYRELKSQFECRAFIRLSRKPDMSKLLGEILSQVHGPKLTSDDSLLQNSIDSIRDHLQHKRYFLVIDDLWETTAWDILNNVLPKGNNCSRIIITAEVQDVIAECCSYQSIKFLEMKSLGNHDSEMLFFHRVCGGKHHCPDQLKEVSSRIITKCGGLPLAIITVAGLLASELDNTDQWNQLLQCFPSSLASLTFKEMLEEIMHHCYNSLPQYLKTCLLYLNMYPEGCTMRKTDLLKEWIAESFVSRTEMGTAESYFNELIKRGLIQPWEVSHDAEIVSCTVHHIVHDLITFKSNEEKFIAAVDYSQTITEFSMKPRRLSLRFSCAQYAAKPEGIRLSQVRSLAFFGLHRCMPSILEFKHLRVLILEFWGDYDDSMTLDLSRISILFHLRYLKVSTHIFVELPSQIQGLQFLETLEMDARVLAVPNDISLLPSLFHLSIRDGTKLPDGIGNITSLKTLQHFNLGKHSEDSVRSLGQLMNLCDLHVTCSTALSYEQLKRNLVALSSSLGRLVKLRTLTLAPAIVGSTVFVDQSYGMFTAPIFLQKLELLSPICTFSIFPEWMLRLRKLRTLKIMVRELLQNGIDTLAGFPDLIVLSLFVRRPTAESVVFPSGAFPALKYFKYQCGALCLAFKDEALPNIQRLKLGFNVHRGEQYAHMITGIENLLNLKEITMHIGVAAGADESDRKNAESAFQDVIGNHPRFHCLFKVKRVDWIEEEDARKQIGAKRKFQQVQHPQELTEPSSNVAEVLVSPAPMPLPFDPVSQAVGTATWLVGVVAERLVGDRVAEWVARHGVGQEEVKRLGTKLRRANLVLGAARAGGWRIRNELEPITEVCRLAADARNLLDEFNYLHIHEQMKDKERNHSSPRSSKAQSIIRFACGFADQTSRFVSSVVKISATNHKEDDPVITKRRIKRLDIMNGIKRLKISDSDDQVTPEGELEGETVLDVAPGRDDISRRIAVIVEELHEVCEDVRKALKMDKIAELARATQSTSSDIREEGACYTETNVFAREVEKDKTIKLITDSSTKNKKLSILPIIGNGGVGKTTFARLVYNDAEVKKEFGIRIWIYVSPIFDEVELTREILECISEGKHNTMPKNWTMLQDGIKTHLTKRFLLVLDDVWEDNERRWDRLLAPLRCTEKMGNVVLVTTRMKSISKITNTMEQQINLGGLKKDVFWLFFKTCIFGDENYQGQRRLQNIGKGIAARLRGNPLAAKTVSTLLKRRLEEGYWQRIFDGDEWKLQEDNDDIMPALMLSYNHLPYHLQRLFSYCGLFPKGHKFNKDQLVHIWIALGFITKERKRPEDTGSDYFDDLVDRSFFEKIETQEYAYYLMHDLIHDLAQSVSADECLTIDGSGASTVSRYVSHISIWTESVYNKKQNGKTEHNKTFEKGLNAIQNNDVLRSLDSLMIVGSDVKTSSGIYAKILGQLKYIRVLCLSTDILQSSIANFIHLRYLELRSTENTDKCLPRSICRLYHLQILDVSQWHGLNDLPRDTCHLVNLRYLIVPESVASHLHSKIVRVGELTSLQELKEFHVQKESGFEVSQLENLNEIRGSLRVFNLDNVMKKDEASCARIKDKKHLRTLSLSWGTGSCNFAEETLEGLQPHDRLEHLHITNYKGATPFWLGENFNLKNLESLHLHDCPGMKILPPFIQLPFLENLSLVGMSSLREIKFDFDNASASTDSHSSEEDVDDFSLTELKIHNCAKLTSLNLRSCKALSKLSIKKCAVLASIDGLQSLDQLNCEIIECPRFQSPPDF